MNTTGLRLREATVADLDAARELFERFPYKAAQAAAQRLDKERLVTFYLAGLRGALEKGTPHWIVEDDGGRALALAGLNADPWHSGVYGMAMGKVAPFINAECGMRNAECDEMRNAVSKSHRDFSLGMRNEDQTRELAGRMLLGAVERAAREQGLAHLSVRIDGEDFGNLHLFEGAGWRLVDVSLKFTRPMAGGAAAGREAPAAAAGWRIELAGPEDAAWIRTMGSRTHGGTHFLNDPALPAEKTRELFARWLDRCLEGMAYRVYVLRDGAGAGRGFVTYLRGPSFAKAVGRSPLILDFVLIDPAVRGGGVGPWFIGESLARETDGGFDYCELRTSAHNLTAVMGYEKLGFRCCASDFVLHKGL